MALIICKECNSEISSRAKECPICGNPKTSLFTWIIISIFGCIFIIVIGAGVIGYLSGPKTSSPTAVEKTNEVGKINDRQRALSRMIIDDEEISIKGNYMFYKARIINEYNKSTVKNVKVRIEWVDDAGKIIDTDWTYAVDNAGLRPKAAKSFQIMTPLDTRVKSVLSYVIKE
jgi:RNA polymerase subunit RPABC4/transcription elongation factor Spt4